MRHLVLVLCLVFLSSTSVYAEQVTQHDTKTEQPSLGSERSAVQSKPPVTEPSSTLVKSPKPASDYEPINSWPVVIGTLFLMVAGIFALGWFARRFNGLNIARNRDMEVLSTLTLGTREKIALVKVRDKTLLLGVTGQQISHLHAFDNEDECSDQDSIERESKGIRSEFSETLKGFMNKGELIKEKNEAHSNDEDAKG